MNSYHAAIGRGSSEALGGAGRERAKQQQLYSGATTTTTAAAIPTSSSMMPLPPHSAASPGASDSDHTDVRASPETGAGLGAGSGKSVAAAQQAMGAFFVFRRFFSSFFFFDFFFARCTLVQSLCPQTAPPLPFFWRALESSFDAPFRQRESAYKVVSRSIGAGGMGRGRAEGRKLERERARWQANLTFFLRLS